jgi:hypothetical protein
MMTGPFRFLIAVHNEIEPRERARNITVAQAGEGWNDSHRLSTEVRCHTERRVYSLDVRERKSTLTELISGEQLKRITKQVE